MLPVGGIFGSQDDARAAHDDLRARGVAPGEMRLEPLREPFWTNLADVDVPAEQASLYEPYVAPNSWMLVVRSTRLSPDEVDEILEAHRGLIVRQGVAPPEADVPLRPSEER